MSTFYFRITSWITSLRVYFMSFFISGIYLLDISLNSIFQSFKIFLFLSGYISFLFLYIFSLSDLFSWIQSSHRFPYGYLVTTSPQSKTPPWYAPIRPPKAFVALVVHRSHGWSLVRCFGRNQFPGCDGRCVQGPGTYSPRHADPRLLAIPTSCSRVAENNPNWGNLSGFAPPYSLASHCNCHCSTCVAQPIRAMRTWRHPHLPPVYHWQSLVSAARTFTVSLRTRFGRAY